MSASQISHEPSDNGKQALTNESARALLPLEIQRKLSVVVPAFNEEQAIAQTLTNLREQLPEAEIIVINDGSTDRTAEHGRSVSGVRVLLHSFNTGYGASLKTGMLAAQREYVAWFDADNEHRVEDLATIVAKLHDQQSLRALRRARLSDERTP